VIVSNFECVINTECIFSFLSKRSAAVRRRR